MGNEQLLRTLGLCAKAGALLYGVPIICEALKSPRGKKPLWVLASNDNAENSAKKLRDKCAYYSTELTVLPVDGAAMAHAVGKTSRLAAVAITDANLCALLKKKLKMASLAPQKEDCDPLE